MAPNRFRHRLNGGGGGDRERRELTPFSSVAMDCDVERRVAETADILLPVSTAEEVPAEWRRVEAPPNFTWVCQDELAGMGWPKSRDQIRFLIEQGIDHLITLSADKIPPHYAFPELKWTLIPVEDFHGPAIRDIKRFLNFMDEARKEGQAVAVHCAEGRGRTGVMCACFLIYYYDLKPWDAIRIMRRQRPGSVERKVQEDTVVMFYQLLQDYGKESLEDLEAKAKEWKEAQRLALAQKTLRNCQNLLPNHTASFYGAQQRPESKIQRLERIQQRMRRCRSMPKMSQEEEEAEKNEMQLRMHMQNFYSGTSRDRSRARSQPRSDKEGENNSSNNNSENSNKLQPDNHSARAVTPGRALIENLRRAPVPRREARSELPSRETSNSDLAKHFKSFMSAPTANSSSSNNNNVKRVRSFSQPKDRAKQNEKETAVENSTQDSPSLNDNSSTDTSSTISLMSTGGDSDCGRSICSEDKSAVEAVEAEQEEEVEEEEEEEDEKEEEAVQVQPTKIDVSSQAIIRAESSSITKSNNSNANTNSSNGSTITTSNNHEKRRSSIEIRKDPSIDPNNTSAAKRYLRRRRRTKIPDAEEDVEEELDNRRSNNVSQTRRGSTDSTSSDVNRPRPPKYTPKYMVDSSSTYSYYTRLRSRPTFEEDKKDNKNEPKDRDVMRVVITVTESLSPSPSVTNIANKSSSPVRQCSNERLILPSVCEDASTTSHSLASTIRAAFRSSRRSSVSSRSSLEDGYTTPHFRKSSKKNSNSTLSLDLAVQGAESNRSKKKKNKRSRTNPLDEALDIIAKEMEKKSNNSKKDNNNNEKDGKASKVDNDNGNDINTSNSGRRSAAIRRARDERAKSVFSYISSSSTSTSSSAFAKAPTPTSYLDNAVLRRTTGTSNLSSSYLMASRPSPTLSLMSSSSPFSRRTGPNRYSRFLSTRETYI